MKHHCLRAFSNNKIRILHTSHGHSTDNNNSGGLLFITRLCLCINRGSNECCMVWPFKLYGFFLVSKHKADAELSKPGLVTSDRPRGHINKFKKSQKKTF